MRNLFFFFFFLSYGQIDNDCIHIDYTEYINYDVPVIRDETLIIDQKENKTYFLMNISSQIYSPDVDDNIKEEFQNSDVTATVARLTDYNYVIIDHHLKKMDMYYDFARNFYKIDDIFPEMKWYITNEKNVINDIECLKATTYFRGREWSAWFAPSISLPYGPWKFNGLPGLILKAEDNLKQHLFVAKLIKYNDNCNIEIPVNKVIKEISLKEYIEIQDDFYNNIKNTQRGSISTSSKINFLEKETEFEFEWKM